MNKIIIMGENKPYHGHINGAIQQEVLFAFGGFEDKYRISIRSESHQSQSYAKLECWTEKGFATIIAQEPKQHYGIDVSCEYKDVPIPPDIFTPIIERLTNTAWAFIVAGAWPKRDRS